MGMKIRLLLAAILAGAGLSASAQDWAKAKLEKSPRHQEWVKLKHGDREVNCFVVYPEVKDKATTIVLIHEIFGLTDWAQEMADELAAEGYIVIAPDYRGSIGYGREWRNGVYMDVGGKDAKDAWMGANYLKTLPYVDADRIGVWGLSYGGFFTLIAMTDQPKLFRAGVDVAGVVDYAMYYSDPYHGDWTASRIGTPEQNPQVYANASPLSHIDRLERPLLILHGTADVNVPFLESVWLMDEALKKHKGDLVSFMIYPGEFHYFTREHVLLDAWHRVDDFFDANLRAPAPSKPKP